MEDSSPGNVACQQPLVTLGVTAPLQLDSESACLTGEQGRSRSPREEREEKENLQQCSIWLRKIHIGLANILRPHILYQRQTTWRPLCKETEPDPPSLRLGPAHKLIQNNLHRVSLLFTRPDSGEKYSDPVS
mgnify:CR=1 FL=1